MAPDRRSDPVGYREWYDIMLKRIEADFLAGDSAVVMGARLFGLGLRGDDLAAEEFRLARLRADVRVKKQREQAAVSAIFTSDDIGASA